MKLILKLTYKEDGIYGESFPINPKAYINDQRYPVEDRWKSFLLFLFNPLVTEIQEQIFTHLVIDSETVEMTISDLMALQPTLLITKEEGNGKKVVTRNRINEDGVEEQTEEEIYTYRSVVEATYVITDFRIVQKLFTTTFTPSISEEGLLSFTPPSQQIIWDWIKANLSVTTDVSDINQ